MRIERCPFCWGTKYDMTRDGGFQDVTCAMCTVAVESCRHAAVWEEVARATADLSAMEALSSFRASHAMRHALHVMRVHGRESGPAHTRRNGPLLARAVGSWHLAERSRRRAARIVADVTRWLEVSR